MLQLTKRKGMPGNREFERLVEFVEGVVTQKPHIQTKEFKRTMSRYFDVMRISLRRYRIEEQGGALHLKYKDSADTYLTVYSN